MFASLRSVAVPCALGLVLLTGCGGASDGGSTTPVADGTPAGGASAAPVDVPTPVLCDLLTAASVSAAVGVPVNLELGPFDDCEFSEADPRGISGSLGTIDVDTDNGGYDGYVAGAGAALTDAVVQDLSGVGDGAFVSTGTIGGGESIQLAGGALVGDQVITVNLSQAKGMSAEELTAIASALLELSLDAL